MQTLSPEILCIALSHCDILIHRVCLCTGEGFMMAHLCFTVFLSFGLQGRLSTFDDGISCDVCTPQFATHHLRNRLFSCSWWPKDYHFWN